MTLLLRAKPYVQKCKAYLSEQVIKCKEKNIIPTLKIFRVGEREDDLSYQRSIQKIFGELEISVQIESFPLSIEQDVLVKAIKDSNQDPFIHGVLLFPPLPPSLDEFSVCEALDPKKDIEGITTTSLSGVFLSRPTGYAPCTASACLALLDFYQISLKKKHICVIGRSNVVGKPVAMLALEENATVTICHSQTKDLKKYCLNADILIVATGKAESISLEYTKPEHIIIDVGIHVREDGSLCGDVDARVRDQVQAISPVPGGVGAATTIILAKHLLQNCLHPIV